VPKKSQTRWIILAAGLVFVTALVYVTYQQTHREFEVCVAFKGNTHCATAKGATPEEAIRSAQEIDCGLLANGRDENIVCLAAEPTGVREIK
jgi:hypothetical protein